MLRDAYHGYSKAFLQMNKGSCMRSNGFDWGTLNIFAFSFVTKTWSNTVCSRCFFLSAIHSSHSMIHVIMGRGADACALCTFTSEKRKQMGIGPPSPTRTLWRRGLADIIEGKEEIRSERWSVWMAPFLLSSKQPFSCSSNKDGWDLLTWSTWRKEKRESHLGFQIKATR